MGRGDRARLDLTLRERSDGRVTLDDFMRAMWDGSDGRRAKTPGYVETPYTIADLKAALAAVSGDAAFAEGFLRPLHRGREVVDYARLLSRAGFVLRPAAAGRAFAGALPLQDAPPGARVSPNVFGTPAYAAGLERGDIIVSVGGAKGDVRRRGSSDRDAQAGGFAAGGIRAPR